MSLFQGEFIFLHSQQATDFKIDCDYLTDEDIRVLAKFISKHLEFCAVYGIPKGGERLAKALEKYCNPDSPIHLIVDDVLTTGGSFNAFKARLKEVPDYAILGVCLFCRRPENKPKWVSAVFNMGWSY